MAMDLSKSRNAERLKKIQEKSAEQANGLVTINVPLEQIDENPDNASIFNMDNIDTLAEGIKEDGFMGAINVFKKPDGRYEISSGHRRYRAMKLLGRATIPCNVSPYPDDVERGLKLISSNIRNRELKPLDWARAIDYYENIMKKKGEYEGRLRDKAAEYFKMAPTNIHRYTSLLKLIPELQELANDPEYAYSAFTSAATLSDADQRELYNKIIRENNALEHKDDVVKVLSRARIEMLINDLKHKDDNLTGQQNKTDGNYNNAALKDFSKDEESEYNTLNHREEFNEEQGLGGSNRDVKPGLVSFDDDVSSSINPPVSNQYDEDNDDELNSDTVFERDFSDNPFENTPGVALNAKLERIVSEIEKLSKSDFNISDKSDAKMLLDRIKAALQNIEKSL